MTEAETDLASAASARRRRAMRNWRRFTKNRLALLGLLLVGGMTVLALLAPVIAPAGPFDIGGARLTEPSWLHWFGTDHLGRDIFTGVLYGARTSLLVGLLSVLMSLAIGIVVGAFAGYYGGRVDGLLMRVTEIFQVMPRFFLALFIMAIVGANIWGITTGRRLPAFSAPEFLTLRERPFVTAALAYGARDREIIVMEILPNAISPIVVAGSLQVASAILLEAALGFLGIGEPNVMSLGSILNNAQQYIRQAWWTVTFPGLALCLLTLGIALVSDGQRLAQSQAEASRAMSESGNVLEVRGLTTRFFTQRGVISAVENISLDVGRGEAVGVVGESGSGKSVTALSVLRLVPMRTVAGSIMLNGRDLARLSDTEMRGVRRNEVAMIFQDASNFLNPILSIGDQIAEGIVDRFPSKRERRKAVIEALHAVRIPEPELVASLYPFQLSGGTQQRAVIAAAVVRQPSLIIADEPITALDATVQFQILRLLEELQVRIGTSLILISHDLAVIAGICSRVYVMYAAEIVEAGPTRDIYRNPAHPYTKALLGSILDPLEERKPLTILEGSIPDLSAPPRGCRFHPRCPAAMPVCSESEPPTVTITSEHQAKCWLHSESTVAA